MKYKLVVEEVSEEAHSAIFAMMAELEKRLSNDLTTCAKYRDYKREEGVKEAADKLRQWHIADEVIGRYGNYKMVEEDSDE